jgi:hypothetical protein
MPRLVDGVKYERRSFRYISLHDQARVLIIVLEKLNLEV